MERSSVLEAYKRLYAMGGESRNPFVEILNHNSDYIMDIRAKQQKKEDEKRLKQEIKAELKKELMAELKAMLQKETKVKTDTENAKKDIAELKEYIDNIFGG